MIFCVQFRFILFIGNQSLDKNINPKQPKFDVNMNCHRKPILIEKFHAFQTHIHIQCGEKLFWLILSIGSQLDCEKELFCH